MCRPCVDHETGVPLSGPLIFFFPGGGNEGLKYFFSYQGFCGLWVPSGSHFLTPVMCVRLGGFLMLKGLSHKIKLTHTCLLAPLMLPGEVNVGHTFLPATSGDFKSSWSLGRPPHGNLPVTPEQRRQRHSAAVTRCRSNRKWGRCRSKLAMLFIFFTKIVCAKFVRCSFSLRGQKGEGARRRLDSFREGESLPGVSTRAMQVPSPLGAPALPFSPQLN